MSAGENLETPSRPWRYASTSIMGLVGILSRGFLYGLSRTETHGLDNFLRILDERESVEHREVGLVTVSNHVSVLDDPMVWGVLPLRHLLNPDNLRWGLGSYDLCFTNKAISAFFTFGQVLPTHRAAYSAHGGLFQPTITEAIRLLSRAPFLTDPNPSPSKVDRSVRSPDLSDPFSGPHLTYSTNGEDTFPAPSAYLSRRHSWVHIFPEGKIHQHPDKIMRYFKWGVARLLLEAEPMPRVVPLWIDGPQNAMDESRTFPRFLPRPGKDIRVVFGQEIDTENVFGDLRRKWTDLKKKEEKSSGDSAGLEIGVLTENLMYSKEAIELRIECTKRVREQVLKVRRSTGLPDEDPKASLAETWKEEGDKREGRMKDGSWVKDV